MIDRNHGGQHVAWQQERPQIAKQRFSLGRKYAIKQLIVYRNINNTYINNHLKLASKTREGRSRQELGQIN